MGQRLVNIGGGVRRFASRLPVIYSHRPDGVRRRHRVRVQAAPAHADIDDRRVHRITHTVLCLVNVLFDPRQQRLAFGIRQFAADDELMEDVPPRRFNPLVVGVNPRIAQLVAFAERAANAPSASAMP